MSIGKSSIARAAGAVGTNKSAAKKETSAKALEFVYSEVVLADLIPMASAPATEASSALVKSVRTFGIIEVLTVCRISDGKLYLLNGCKRVAAARKFGLETLPAKIITVETYKDALKLYRELGIDSDHKQKLHDAKFTAIVSLADDMPDYLL